MRSADRSTFQKFLDDISATASLRIEPMAALAAEVEGSYTLGAYRMFSRPLLNGRTPLFVGDELVLALYGKLDASQRTRLLRGEPVTWTSLRPEQRQIVEKIVYGEGGIHLSHLETGEFLEPTQVLGSGIPAGSTISAVERREPMFLISEASRPHGPLREVDLGFLAQALLYERRPELRSSRSQPPLVVDRVALAEQRTIDLTLTFEKAGVLWFQMRESSRPGKLGPIEQLPAEIRDQLETAVAQLEQSARRELQDSALPAMRPPRP